MTFLFKIHQWLPKSTNSQNKAHAPPVASKVLYELASSTSMASSQPPFPPPRGLCDILSCV